jgi:hypothetical protein
MCDRQRAHALTPWLIAAALPLWIHDVRAQAAAASVSLPDSSIRAIAADFDAGRNPIYCFQGIAEAPGVVRVEGVTIVSSTAECFGIGIGFISRIDDHDFLGGTLQGLMAQNARFRVVSAFYRIEIVNDGGHPTRAPRAMTVIRGTPGAKASEEDAHQRRVEMRGG